MKRPGLFILLGPVVVAIRLLRPSRAGRPLRSLWSGTPIHTLGVKARAERLLGVDARSLVYTAYSIGGRFDHNLERWRRVPLAGRLVPPAVFAWACWRFDRFHFFCDRGLLPQLAPWRFNALELAFYRFLGKEVFFWTYGADVRTTERTRALGPDNCCTDCPALGTFCVCDETTGSRNVETIRRRATAVFSMGDMTEYTPGSRNDLFFWPVDLEAGDGRTYEPRFPDAAGREPVRLVHAPNHRALKGTSRIIEAAERLRAQGVPIELVLVEGVPNEEALEIYRSADIVIDQCLIGFHGYLAQEAMALGKPVVCFIRRPDEYLLCPDECPIVNAPASDLAAVLKRLAADRPRLRELGLKGRRYIETHHTLRAFSERLARAYGDIEGLRD